MLFTDLGNAGNFGVVGAEVEVIDLFVVRPVLVDWIEVWEGPDPNNAVVPAGGHHLAVGADPHHLLVGLWLAKVRLDRLEGADVEDQAGGVGDPGFGGKLGIGLIADAAVGRTGLSRG